MSKETQNETENQETKLFSDTNISEKTGTIVRDAELVADGKFVKFTIANNRQYLDENSEIKTTTNYFDALVSGNLKEAFNTAQSLKKGDWIHLVGNDSTSQIRTSEGYKKNSSVIYAFDVSLRKRKNENSSEKPTNPEMS